MLELSQVVPDIARMGTEVRRRRERAALHLQTALRQARLDADVWAGCRARAQTRLPWLPADCPERPGEIHDLPEPVPARYTALATDGSQIPMDRHAVAPCYLLNVGEIVLHYGSGERPRLSSRATLHYRDEEIYQSENGADPVPLSDKIIANRRLLAESDALAVLIAEHRDRLAVALVDDPLIVWTPQGEPEAEQRRVIDQFCRMLEAGQDAGTPVAGYVSRPGHRDVVGALRASLCPDGCLHESGSPCAALAALTDAQVFADLLSRPGERSPLFRSRARSLSLYPEAHRVSFFYLNVGPEIVRVEVPEWVAADRDLLGRVHALCFDQASKGQGYPVALAEAHEQAVVRAAERDAFFRLVENAFVQQNLPALQTRKALAKRLRVL